MSIEKKDDDSTKTWVHQKNGAGDGFPQYDWTAFMNRVECGIQMVNAEGSCDVDGVVKDSERLEPNSSSKLAFGIQLGLMANLSFVLV